MLEPANESLTVGNSHFVGAHPTSACRMVLSICNTTHPADDVVIRRVDSHRIKCRLPKLVPCALVSHHERRPDPIDHFGYIPCVREIVEMDKRMLGWIAILEADLAATVGPHLAEEVLESVRDLDVSRLEIGQKRKELVLQGRVSRIA